MTKEITINLKIKITKDNQIELFLPKLQFNKLIESYAYNYKVLNRQPTNFKDLTPLADEIKEELVLLLKDKLKEL